MLSKSDFADKYRDMNVRVVIGPADVLNSFGYLKHIAEWRVALVSATDEECNTGGYAPSHVVTVADRGGIQNTLQFVRDAIPSIDVPTL